MHPVLWGFFGLAVLLRGASLWISWRHERALVEAGAEQFGARNSAALAGLHGLFYAGALAEGLWRRAQPDLISLLGMGLYLFAMAMLGVVIRQLRGLWTVKLYLAPDHGLNRHWLFRRVRHPNYILNVLPELVGLALVLKAGVTMVTLLPLYLVSLGIRIAQEEKVMRQRFPDYLVDDPW